MANAASTTRAPIGAAVFQAMRRADVFTSYRAAGLFRLFPGLAEVVEQANPNAGRARSGVVGGDVGLIAVRVGGARDVQVHPRDLGDKLLQKQRGGDRAGAASPAVADVGHGGLDLLAIDL